MPLTITVPVITAVTLSPNPVSINSALTITATVTEQTVTLEETYPYCGEINCGEEFYL